MNSKLTLSVGAALLALTVFFLSGIASAGFPVARSRPPLVAAKNSVSRFELPIPGKPVRRIDVDLPTGKVTERISVRLRSGNDAAIIPSKMLDNPSTTKSLSSLVKPRGVQPQATLISEDMIVVRHPALNVDHYVPFRSTGMQPSSQRLQQALSRLPEQLYTNFGSIDEIVFDGSMFTVIVDGKSIPLILPPFTRRQWASYPTYATP